MTKGAAPVWRHIAPGELPLAIGVIAITGIGDHLRSQWPITVTGMRSRSRSPAGNRLSVSIGAGAAIRVAITRQVSVGSHVVVSAVSLHAPLDMPVGGAMRDGSGDA
jgi:hypothetical protein